MSLRSLPSRRARVLRQPYLDYCPSPTSTDDMERPHSPSSVSSGTIDGYRPTKKARCRAKPYSKSSGDDKKVKKNDREKERRSMLTAKFEELGGLLDLERQTRTERFTILAEAIHLIRRLSSENKSLKTEKQFMRSELTKLTSSLQYFSQQHALAHAKALGLQLPPAVGCGSLQAVQDEAKSVELAGSTRALQGMASSYTSCSDSLSTSSAFHAHDQYPTAPLPSLPVTTGACVSASSMDTSSTDIPDSLSLATAHVSHASHSSLPQLSQLPASLSGPVPMTGPSSSLGLAMAGITDMVRAASDMDENTPNADGLHFLSAFH